MAYDQDISFQIAKVAKLRGFPQRNYSEGYTATGDWCGDFALDVINGRECYAIATQGEVVAWLRKEHKLLVNMDFFRQDNRGYWMGSIQSLEMGNFVFEESYEGVEYEEAFEDLLKTTLLVYLEA
jgi:hypothetical protein